MLSKPISLSTPRNGGTRNAANPWTNIEYQEILRTGNLSRKQWKLPKKSSLTPRFKKLPTRVKALGNLWAGLINANYLLLRLLSTIISCVLLSTVFGMFSTPYSILLFINKSTFKSLTRLVINHYSFGYYSPKKNSSVQSETTITCPLQDWISYHGTISSLFSNMMNALWILSISWTLAST